MLVRQLTATPAVMGSIFASILLCGLFLVATPLLFARLADDALLEAVSTPQAQLRNISAALSTVVDAGPSEDPFAGVRQRGASFRDSQMTETVKATMRDLTWVVDSPQFSVSGMPGSQDQPKFSGSRWAGTLMRFRYQSDIDENVSLVAGSMPRPHDPVVVGSGDGCGEAGSDQNLGDADCVALELPVFEVAVTRETLEFLSVDVGEMLLLTPDLDDTSYFGIPRESLTFKLALKIAGLIDIDDFEDDYWFNDPRLTRPRLRSNNDFTFVFATGLMSPGDYDRLLLQLGHSHWGYQWRYFIDPSLIQESTLDLLASDLTRLKSAHPVSSHLGTSEFGVNTKLPTFIEGYSARRSSTLAVMSTSIAGMFVVTMSMILMLSALATERQRSDLVLLRGRGASRIQMGVTRALQGLVLSVPPAVIALVSMTLLISGSSGVAGRLAGGLIVASTVAFVIAAGPVVFGDLGLRQRLDASMNAVPGRRLVIEGLVGMSALAAVVIVRRRGLVGVAGRDPDLLLAMTPTLVIVALGLVVFRIYPFLIRLPAYLGRRRRGVVMFVGFRRVLQQSGTGRLPVMVMLLAVALASTASVTRLSMSEAQIRATWNDAGAAYRLSESNAGSPLTGEPDFSAIESFEAQAVGVRFPETLTRAEPGVPLAVDLLFVEVDSYSAVNAGTPADPDFPPEMMDSPGAAAGSEDNPIPVIVTRAWDGNPPSVGLVFKLSVDGPLIYMEIRAVRESFPAMPIDRAVVVADLRHLDSLVGPTLTRPTVMYVRAHASDLDQVENVVIEQTLDATLVAQAPLLAELKSEQFASGLERSLFATFWLAALLAAFAAVTSLVVSASTRKRDFGYLRTQGLTVRQAVWMTVIEQLPAIVVASVVGVVSGIGIAVMLEPTIDLSSYTGSPLEVGLVIDVGPVAYLVLGIVAGLAAVTAMTGFIRRREDLAGLLRLGDE